MQGKAVTKIPRAIIERDEIIQSLLEDVDDIYAEKDGRAKGDRLVRNIKKLIKVNDQEKEKVGLQRLEYLPGAAKTVKPPRPQYGNRHRGCSSWKISLPYWGPGGRKCRVRP